MANSLLVSKSYFSSYDTTLNSNGESWEEESSIWDDLVDAFECIDDEYTDLYFSKNTFGKFTYYDKISKTTKTIQTLQNISTADTWRAMASVPFTTTSGSITGIARGSLPTFNQQVAQLNDGSYSGTGSSYTFSLTETGFRVGYFEYTCRNNNPPRFLFLQVY